MVPLFVSTFPNAKALPLLIARDEGLARAHGIDLVLHETGSSDEQRRALAAGEIHIAQAAVDNAVAMIVGGQDVVVFMGGEGGMNDLVVQPWVSNIAALSGAVLAVDSPQTAYALLARELLARHGLQLDRDYQLRAIGNGAKRLAALCTDTSLAAAILNPPFTAMAQARGLKVLANMDDAVGPYQAGGAFALRSWLAANRALAVAYIRTYIAALQWMLAHPAQARAMLIAKLDLTRDIAAATYAKLCNPVTGFQPRAALSRAGFDRMLQIRAASAPGTPPLTYEACVDDMLYAEAILKQ